MGGTKDYVEAVADLKRAMEIEPQNKKEAGMYATCSRRWRRRATAAAAAATPRPRMGTAPPRRRTARRAAAASRRRPARRAAAERDASDAAAKKVAPGDRLSDARMDRAPRALLLLPDPPAHLSHHQDLRCHHISLAQK